jgi:uncharacterized protein with HEPN domain
MVGESRDAALLLDMLAYAERAVQVIEGLSFERYEKDPIRVLALERALEIVGEAARNVSSTRKQGIPEIPWALLNGQRNVLAHMYGDIDQFRLFRTASEDIPGLIAVLRKLSA